MYYSLILHVVGNLKLETFSKILLCITTILTMTDPVNVLMNIFTAHEMSSSEFSPRGCLFDFLDP